MELETFFTTAEQTQLFLLSCVMGVPLGIIFDIFRALRAVLPHNRFTVALEDTIFLGIYSVMLSLFCVVFSRSEFRVFYIVGNILGFGIYFFTLGNIVLGAIRKAVEAIRNVFRFIYRKLRKLVSPIIKKIKPNTDENINKIITKCKFKTHSRKNHKIDLIDDEELLYNNATMKSS